MLTDDEVKDVHSEETEEGVINQVGEPGTSRERELQLYIDLNTHYLSVYLSTTRD